MGQDFIIDGRAHKFSAFIPFCQVLDAPTNLRVPYALNLSRL